MSFGVGIGDLIQVGTLSWNLYRGCRDSSDEFKRISQEVAALHVVIKETEEQFAECKGLSPTRDYRLGILLEGTNDVLQELKKLLDNYESLGTQAQRTWDRMRWGMENMADVRSRLISNTTLLTAFNSALASSSTARIERRLNKLFAEVRAGLREGSVVTTTTIAESLESEDIWKQLQRELEDVGISAAVIQENQSYISQWVKTAITNGMLEEGQPSVSLEFSRLTMSDSGDSGYGGSTYAPTLASISVANEEFENDLKKHPTRAALAEGSSTSFSQQAIKVRKASAVSSVLFKLLKKETAIIEAASDGDLAKVAKLISAGANVNARDRWGWSALSMCGYGGHVEIAKLLLEHGAEIDNVDVDGDTPELLATNRKHAAIVFLLDEERQRRDAKIREDDTELPKSRVNSAY